MPIRFYKPHGALAPYIKNYGHVFLSPDNNNDLTKIDFFPHGFSALIYNLNQQEHISNGVEDIKICFRFSGQFDIHTGYHCKSANFVFMNFKPFGAYYLLGIPQQELLNSKIEIRDIFPNTQTLYHQLEDAEDDVSQIICLLENWLLDRLADTKYTDTNRYEFATSFIMKNQGSLPVQQLYGQLGMSATRMEHHFNEKIGLSPKKFSRIVRFNECMRFLANCNDENINWTSVACQFGYFDQMHFIREFKQFCGYSPTKFELSRWNMSKLLTL